MNIKICGLNNFQNILDVEKLKPDFMGFIFYENSPRYPRKVPSVNVNKVGVFVNESTENIIRLTNKYQLNFIQLHGNESVKQTRELSENGLKIIKAFSITDTLPVEELKKYSPFCSYFLFDTKGKHYGGNGKKFDWEILREYTLTTPFLLSGGIKFNDVNEIKSIKHPAFAGVDLNSGFEVEKGFKNIEQLRKFIHELRNK